MRGSARRSPGEAVSASAPRGLAGDFIPVHPDQERAQTFPGPTQGRRTMS